MSTNTPAGKPAFKSISVPREIVFQAASIAALVYNLCFVYHYYCEFKLGFLGSILLVFSNFISLSGLYQLAIDEQETSLKRYLRLFFILRMIALILSNGIGSLFFWAADICYLLAIFKIRFLSNSLRFSWQLVTGLMLCNLLAAYIGNWHSSLLAAIASIALTITLVTIYQKQLTVITTMPAQQ